MIFVSKDRGYSLLMRPGYQDIRETMHGPMPKVVKPIFLKFEPLNSPINAPLLFGGIGNGMLNSEVVANQTGIEKEEIETFLLSHNKHGVRFVGITEAGETADPAEIWLVPEGDDGGWYCKLCDKHFTSVQGKNGHVGSNEHKSGLREQESEQRKQWHAAIA